MLYYVITIKKKNRSGGRKRVLWSPRFGSVIDFFFFSVVRGCCEAPIVRSVGRPTSLARVVSLWLWISPGLVCFNPGGKSQEGDERGKVWRQESWCERNDIFFSPGSFFFFFSVGLGYRKNNQLKRIISWSLAGPPYMCLRSLLLTILQVSWPIMKQFVLVKTESGLEEVEVVGSFGWRGRGGGGEGGRRKVAIYKAVLLVSREIFGCPASSSHVPVRSTQFAFFFFPVTKDIINELKLSRISNQLTGYSRRTKLIQV